MKCMSLFIIFWVLFAHLHSLRVNGGNKTLNNKSENLNKFASEGIIWQGWVKYITFNGDEINNANKFLENYAFFNQKITKGKKDDKGVDINIPSKFNFYVVLLESKINFLNSRWDKLENNYESLELNSILPLGDNIWKSSIQNLGDFSEGSCIQIFTKVGNGLKKNWVICLSKPEDREILWNYLVSLKKQLHRKSENEKDIYSDKNKCNNIPEKKVIEHKDGLDNIMNQMNIEEKEHFIEKKLKDKERCQMDAKVKKTEAMALQALKKEMAIEKMLENEMIIKMQSETKAVEEEIKDKALKEAIKDSEDSECHILDKEKTEKQIAEIKAETAKDIKQKRDELKERLLRIQKNAQRRNKPIKQEIRLIRGDMVRKLLDDNKQGNSQICKDAVGDEKKMILYCNDNVIDDFVKNKECKKQYKFCYICCENEFGDIFLDKREGCYGLCETYSNNRISNTTDIESIQCRE